MIKCELSISRIEELFSPLLNKIKNDIVIKAVTSKENSADSVLIFVKEINDDLLGK